MTLQNHNFEQTPTHREPKSRGNNLSNFIAAVAVLLSTLALAFSGFTAYQVFTLQQKLDSLSNTVTRGVNIPNPTNTNANPGNSQPETTATAPVVPTAPNPVASAPTNSASAIQAGQFIQTAVGNKAQVELLSVKRIKDPEAGTRDVVNVQMRIRRLASEVQPGVDNINVSATTARNPDTSETYKGISWDRSSGTVSLYSVRRQASADAYVWLRIPEGVNNIDLYIPDTGAFQNVPIS